MLSGVEFIAPQLVTQGRPKGSSVATDHCEEWLGGGLTQTLRHRVPSGNTVNEEANATKFQHGAGNILLYLTITAQTQASCWVC